LIPIDIGSWEFWRAQLMATDDFFRARLDSMIDMRHPLAVLATRMPWNLIEASLTPLLAHKDRDGRLVRDADLFGPTAQLTGAGLSNAGRPRLPLRLMVALLYLKHAFNLSDEELCERWSENVVWQFFSRTTSRACPATPRRSAAFAACWARPASSSCSSPPSKLPCRWAQ
jgi:IS5 family transposase